MFWDILGVFWWWAAPTCGFVRAFCFVGHPRGFSGNDSILLFQEDLEGCPLVSYTYSHCEHTLCTIFHGAEHLSFQALMISTILLRVWQFIIFPQQPQSDSHKLKYKSTKNFKYKSSLLNINIWSMVWSVHSTGNESTKRQRDYQI